jgi:tRNA-dihydrouridine synthase C
VRRAVPAAMPVSAKMRLGHRDESRMLDCALAIEAAGASELTVHARTKVHGYRPPAYWDRIATIRAAVRLPVVANGEAALMLGRGIVADPGLALAIRGAAAPDWDALRPLVRHYWHRIASHVSPRHRAGRLKQWLNLLRRRFAQAQVAFDTVRTFNDPLVVEALLFGADAPKAGRPPAGAARPADAAELSACAGF